jgi:mannan endo-1,4-beta-mannosidase
LTVAVILGLTAPAAAANVGFASAQGGQFRLNGQPYRFVSTNAYFLLDSVNYGSTAHTEQMLAVANALGFPVLRTWAFMDGTGLLGGFQTAPGVYDETVAKELDWILYRADQAGVRLILTLVNHWPDYGGMPQYVQWCSPGSPVDAFYTNATCRQIYKSWVSFLVNRVNTFNGRAYRDDPTIFAWELANEPRATDPGALRAWIGEMAAYVKSIDPNHLVGTGEEGFDTTTAGYSSLATYNNQGWLFDGGGGAAFTENTADANIDFGSVHLYPEAWNFAAAAGSNWIVDHIRIARQLGKPLLVGEFGFSSDPYPVFLSWLEAFEAEHGAGALVWQLICQACVNHAGFDTVYPPITPISTLLAGAATTAASSSGGTGGGGSGGGGGSPGGFGLAVSHSSFTAGQTATVTLHAPNPPLASAADVYFGALLPPAAGPSVGCPAGDAMVFFTAGFTGVAVACQATAPAGFQPLAQDVPPAAFQDFSLSFVWPTGLPAGSYTFFLALTRPGAFADGSIDPGDILELSTSAITLTP